MITISAAVDGLARSSADPIAVVDVGPTTTTLPPPATVRPLPTTPGVAPVVTRVATTDPVVFLTIDDGHTRTAVVAEALRELGAPASLFLVDGPVTHGAGFFRQLDATVVQGHTQTHPDLRTLPEDRQRNEICRNAQLIEEVFGQRPVLFRPPFGSYDAATQRAAADCGMRAIVLWEVAADGGELSFRQTPQLRPGDIVLLHFRPELRQDLRALAQRVEDAGLRFARLEDYLVPEAVPR